MGTPQKLRKYTMLLKRIVEKIRKKRFYQVGSGLSVIAEPIYSFNNNVILGNNVHIYPGVTFFGDGKIIIGDNVKIGNNVIMNSSANGGIIIGNNTIIAANTYIIDNNHNIRKDSLIQKQGFTSELLTIGEDVWIGASCVIGKGSHIGNGAVVGANSFVNSKIEDYSIAFGTPAKIVKYRV